MTRAAQLVAHGEPLHVEDVELPKPSDGEVMVDLLFGGVNPVDRYVIEGRAAPEGPLPRTMAARAPCCRRMGAAFAGCRSNRGRADGVAPGGDRRAHGQPMGAVTEGLGHGGRADTSLAGTSR